MRNTEVLIYATHTEVRASMPVLSDKCDISRKKSKRHVNIYMGH